MKSIFSFSLLFFVLFHFFSFLETPLAEKSSLRRRGRAKNNPVVQRRGGGGCHFPPDWDGVWFQSMVRPYISIEAAAGKISGKGSCVVASGDKYVLRESASCYKCIVVHQRAKNVLQYKETFGCEPTSMPPSVDLCRSIPGDATLYSMFRVDGAPIECPFRGAYDFAYNRGKGECSEPHSEAESCTLPSRMVFRYQACPNVQGSEMMTEELECQAAWRDGSFRYLVGKLTRARILDDDEDRFRCFIFEYDNPLLPDKGGVRVAQSGDATCNGIFSPTDGPSTIRMYRGPSKAKCRFPRWLAREWRSLDGGRRLTLTAQGDSFIVLRRTFTADSGYDRIQEAEAVCHQSESLQNGARFVIYQKSGCETGFVCVDIKRKKTSGEIGPRGAPAAGSVISAAIGKMSRTAEYACDETHFGTSVLQEILLIDEEVLSSSPSFPFRGGIYKIEEGVFSTSSGDVVTAAKIGDDCTAADAKANGGADQIDKETNDQETLVLGCDSRMQMLFLPAKKTFSNCEDKSTAASKARTSANIPSNKGYRLVHSWTDVSQRWHYVIFSGLNRRISMCFVLKKDAADDALTMTKLDQNCRQTSASTVDGGGTPETLRLVWQNDCSEFSGFVSSRSGGGGKNCIRMLVVDVVAKLFIILLNLSLFPGFLL